MVLLTMCDSVDNPCVDDVSSTSYVWFLDVLCVLICCLWLPTTLYILVCSVAESVGRTVWNTYLCVGWLVIRKYSRLEDLHCAKVGLRGGGIACKRFSLSSTNLNAENNIITRIWSNELNVCDLAWT